ncbi:MAG: DUF2975 domain-containing protein [Bacteroidales bacterium]|nr:DUF2975 domain-containing protein [Bacteroidales bacterium]
MKKINLFLANLLIKIAIVICCLMIAFLLFITIHSTISSRYYDKLILNKQGAFEYSPHAQEPLISYSEYKDGKNLNIYFNRITFASKARYMFFPLLKLFLVLLILLEFNKILLSIKTYSSFFVNNSKYCKRIGIYLMLILACTLISDIIGIKVSMNFPDGAIINTSHFFYINNYLTTLLFLSMAFILSAIFKEGERLRIENELTV